MIKSPFTYYPKVWMRLPTNGHPRSHRFGERFSFLGKFPSLHRFSRKLSKFPKTEWIINLDRRYTYVCISKKLGFFTHLPNFARHESRARWIITFLIYDFVWRWKKVDKFNPFTESKTGFALWRQMLPEINVWTKLLSLVSALSIVCLEREIERDSGFRGAKK
jgi:hypothetical protein